FVFFFQAEDGIRDFHVTGVQTCALPISAAGGSFPHARAHGPGLGRTTVRLPRGGRSPRARSDRRRVGFRRTSPVVPQPGGRARIDRESGVEGKGGNTRGGGRGSAKDWRV